MATQLQVARFEEKLAKALQHVRVVLDATKHPCFAGSKHHQYQDKYWLAESMTNMAAASQVNCLMAIGLTLEQLAAATGWSQASAVSLQFRAEERCSFVREETKEVEDPTKHVEEHSVMGVVRSTITSKTITKKTSYFWKFDTTYQLSLVRGTGSSPEDRLRLVERSASQELVTTTKTTPFPEAKIPAAAFDVNISWLIRQLRETTSPGFRINRSHPKCCTPRRNEDIGAALCHFERVSRWSQQVTAYLDELFRKHPGNHGLDLGSISAEAVFVPVLPLFEEDGAGSTPAPEAVEVPSLTGPAKLLPIEGMADSALLPLGDLNRLLGEEDRTLQEKGKALGQAFPAEGLISAPSAFLSVSMRHCCEVAARHAEAMDYIESLLRHQLIAAIGKEVTPADFSEYMVFHNRKLFHEAFMPAPFCFAVRRSVRHSPEGTLSIEQKGHHLPAVAEPIVTLAAKGTKQQPMQFALSASATVTFHGERYLHAWLCHKFSGDTGAGVSLVSRARQFSSMLVLVGRIASATTFDPKFAAVVQNKDELTIPLEMSTIPTPKEFKDAIESLSPEQQNFAKAFRSMQLESTLFGVLVIQIKPQLEKVLNLSPDSLTKEIKLTQDLMQLFAKYQIPSDLLSFDAQADPSGMELVGATPHERLEAVKSHVAAMKAMIDQAKQEEIEDRKKQESYIRPLAEEKAEARFCDVRMEEECRPMMRSRVMKRSAARSAAPRSVGLSMASAPAPVAAMAVNVSAAAPAVPIPATSEQVHQSADSHEEPSANVGSGGGAAASSGTRDYTEVPKELDRRFEELDEDAALRPTIITPASTWTKREQKALLAEPSQRSLDSDELKREKDAAFDLLDALTKSGALPVDHAELHVVVAATHCFDKTVLETVVQDNISPIDKVERSTLIMASTIHQQPVPALIYDSHHPRISAASPKLFAADALAEH